MPAKDDSFLGRWSRRKQEVAKEAKAPAVVEEALPDQAVDEAEPEALSDAEILESLGLPDPDELGLGDDFKRYMTAAVPQRIKQRAMRKLWLSNPVLANLDGLNDYEQDFTDAATVVKDLATSYEIGRGFAKRVSNIVEDLGQEPSAPQDDAAEQAMAENDVQIQGESDQVFHIAPKAEVEAPEDEPRPAPRRMAFTFEANKS